MLNHIKKCEQSMMAGTLITLILGIILAINPVGSIKLITAIIAFLFTAIAIFQIFEYIIMSKQEKYMSFSLVLGIVCLVIGLYLFFNTGSLVKFITIIIGACVCIKSLFKIQFALNLKNISDKWTYNLIVGIVSMIMGLILLFNPFESAALFLRIIGIILVIGSIAELIETGVVMHSLSDVKELEFVEKNKKNKKNDKLEIVEAEKVEEE